MVDDHPVRRSVGYLVPVKRCEAICDGGPCTRVNGTLARDISRVEFCYRSVEVFVVEQDAPYDPLIRIGFDDVQHFDFEGLGPVITAGDVTTQKRQAIATGCD